VTDAIAAQVTPDINVSLRQRSHWQQLGNKIFILIILLLLGLGWYQREDSYFEAESGLGYVLGIVGGSLMLLLLLYPLRKRLRVMDRFFSIKFWFRVHMLFGILGPVAILYHSSFSLGSMNSSIALVCMLLVASSGLIGRYLYVKIHHGLYGARTRITEYQAMAEQRREVLVRALPHGERIISELEGIEKIGTTQAHGLIHSLRLRKMTKVEIKRIRKLVRKVLKHEYKKGKRISRKAAKVISQGIEEYFITVKRATDLRVNERLFAWWHILHFPLFLMMLFTGIVHVFVVHMY
jgi:histone H3/H4